MNNDTNTGLDQSQSTPPTPVAVDKTGKLADYYALNTETASTEGSEDVEQVSKPVVSEVVKSQPEDSTPKGDTKQPSQGKGFERRIGVLTARDSENKKIIARLEQRLADLEKGNGKKQEPQRETYQTQAEYDKAVAKEASKEALNEQLSAMREQQVANESVEAFRQSVKQKANATMTQGEREHYSEMIADGFDPEEMFTPAVREFLDDSELGIRMMYTLMSHPELIERLNGLKGTTLAARLIQLEDITQRDLQSIVNQAGKGPATKTVVDKPKPATQAPAPIGDFGAVGGSVANQSDEEKLAQYYKRNPR